jgi:hypothetical protein
MVVNMVVHQTLRQSTENNGTSDHHADCQQPLLCSAVSSLALGMDLVTLFFHPLGKFSPGL